MSKKYLFILIISMLSYLSVKAQKDTLVYYMKNRNIGKNSFDEVVNTKDSADFYRVILPQDSTDKNLFIVNDFYKNGKPKMIGKTINHNSFLRLEGVSIEYFPNGRRKSTMNFKNNNPVGDVVEYYPNGKLYITGTYNQFSKLLINECRDSTGKILAESGDGYYIKYDKEFKKILGEGNIKNGLEEGEWHSKLNDSIKYVGTYVNGLIKNGTSYDLNGKEYPFSTIDEEPKFKKGLAKFLQFVSNNIRYPEWAKKNNVQGKVFVAFTIQKDGTLANIRVIRGIGSDCNEEVIRVLKLSPKWIPGTHYGVPIDMDYTLPISFSLSDPHFTNFPHTLSPPDSH